MIVYGLYTIKVRVHLNDNKNHSLLVFYVFLLEFILGEFLFLTNLIINNYSSNQNYLEYTKTILYLYNIFLTNMSVYV